MLEGSAEREVSRSAARGDAPTFIGTALTP
jgi:hypothetical protein